ncbi:Uncharacterised protein [Mycobacteroides abscessus]|nr:Uncharacterised protein [Mycobacteroides abscessus]SHX69193.1 Uncharacterised protein [Mycobacteroides abscessus subsp. abscessus]SIN32198.1 Uncharacterised protein [Mycobacteroides abscessus subsp. abscessus]SKY63172.1 Uncharacterised protein [Mycobacteroides abscessus subsp. abscessus]
MYALPQAGDEPWGEHVADGPPELGVVWFVGEEHVPAEAGRIEEFGSLCPQLGACEWIARPAGTT